VNCPWRECGYAAGFVAMLMAVYAAAYFCTVSPETVMTAGDPRLGLGSFALVTEKRPRYAVDHESVSAFFGPMHAADRCLRPGVWAAK
jgi:hypothetical protein